MLLVRAVHRHLHGNIGAASQVHGPEDFGPGTPPKSPPELESSSDDGVPDVVPGASFLQRRAGKDGGHPQRAAGRAGAEVPAGSVYASAQGNQASSWNPHWHRHTGGSTSGWEISGPKV